MQEQLNKIWKTYHPQLINFVKRRVKDKSVAEDIVQDVFLKAQLKFDTLKDYNKIRGWLFQITRNSIIDYYRKNKPIIRIEGDLATDHSTEENDVKRRLQKNVLTMICQLPLKYCEALCLADYYGLKQSDIAQELGIKYNKRVLLIEQDNLSPTLASNFSVNPPHVWNEFYTRNQTLSDLILINDKILVGFSDGWVYSIKVKQKVEKLFRYGFAPIISLTDINGNCLITDYDGNLSLIKIPQK